MNLKGRYCWSNTRYNSSSNEHERCPVDLIITFWFKWARKTDQIDLIIHYWLKCAFQTGSVDVIIHFWMRVLVGSCLGLASNLTHMLQLECVPCFLCPSLLHVHAFLEWQMVGCKQTHRRKCIDIIMCIHGHTEHRFDNFQKHIIWHWHRHKCT